MKVSPKTQFARDLIARLQSSPDLSHYVLPDVFAHKDQYQTIKLAAQNFGGCLAVTPQMLVNPDPDPSVRDATIYCDYVLLAVVNTRVKPKGALNAVSTASDWIDCLLGAALPLISTWSPYESPLFNPVVLDETEVEIPSLSSLDILCRGLRIRVALSYEY